MKVAFHFNAAHSYLKGTLYHLPIQEKCFRILLSGDNNKLHLKIFSGDLVIRSTARNQDHLERLVFGLLNPPHPVWQDIHSDLHDIVFTHRIYVLAFDGMTRKVRDVLNNSLKEYDPYLGAQQIHEANPCHWVLYNQSLPIRYRMLGKELRIFYYSWDKDGKDEELAYYWRDFFTSVTFEDLGIKHTIFDSYDSYEHAQRVADLYEILGDHLAMLADELLMRLEDMNPQVCNMLYSAFQRLDHFETIEDLSQASVTCRRILKAFADAVYPPIEEVVNGHSLGKEQYINRLWAYINEHASGKEKALLVDLEDVGGRLDRLYELASKGVHAKISHREVQRLILGEIILIYDLLALVSPPKNSSTFPVDTDFVKDVMRDLLGPTKNQS